MAEEPKRVPRRDGRHGRAEPKARPTTTIVLVDDHTLVVQGLKALLHSEGDLVVVGVASDGRRAVELVSRLHPDVVVMDIAMPRLNGLEATRQILQTDPDVAIVILSAHSDPEYIERTRELGAAAYVLKDSSLSAFAAAIRAAKTSRGVERASQEERRGTKGGRAPARASPLASVPSLSVREVEVLQLIAEGMANKQTAAELGISIKTVEKHRQKLMTKLDIHDVAGLTRFAIAVGIIEGRNRGPGY
ncbi:MAG: response regulator transcription factor [Planctomycetes bacterium]|nr:response regulator transcription factor [Planctomycetota bacterium]